MSQNLLERPHREVLPPCGPISLVLIINRHKHNLLFNRKLGKERHIKHSTVIKHIGTHIYKYPFAQSLSHTHTYMHNKAKSDRPLTTHWCLDYRWFMLDVFG